MSAAQNLEHDGIYLSTEEWAEIQETLRLVREKLVGPKTDLIGTRETATMLGISQQTVRNRYRAGKMPKCYSTADEDLKFKRTDIERLAGLGKKTGRPRKAV